jgi:hypothetical protein
MPRLLTEEERWAALVHAVPHGDPAIRELSGLNTLTVSDASGAFTPYQGTELASRRAFVHTIGQ